MIEDPSLLDAWQQVDLLSKRELTSVELLEAHIKRIRKFDKFLNTVVTLDEEGAFKAAQIADERLASGASLGRLHGLPMLIKDATSVKGMRSTYGMLIHRNLVPKNDAESVATIRNLGAIIFGRTNVPIGAVDWQSFNFVFGRSKNPWNLRHTPGGSSGGAAAAVAAGFTPLEMGSDLAGSIRYPSHCCGVWGMRPTEGLVSIKGMGPESVGHEMDQLVTKGPIARNIKDLRLGLAAMTGRLDQMTPEVFKTLEPRKLRLCYSDSILGVTPSKEYRAQLAAFRKRLADAGHEVTVIAIDEKFLIALRRIWAHMSAYEMGRYLPKFLSCSPWKQPFRRVGPRLIYGDCEISRLITEGLGRSQKDHEKDKAERNELIAEMDRLLAPWDAWLTPVSVKEAIEHQLPGRSIIVDDKKVPYAEALATFLVPTVSAAGPTIAAPIGHTAGGLPLGIQLTAGTHKDWSLLDTATALAPQTRPWTFPLV